MGPPRRRLTIREALELSPWDKWLQFGIVPWKMLLHLLLVFFITFQARGNRPRSAHVDHHTPCHVYPTPPPTHII